GSGLKPLANLVARFRSRRAGSCSPDSGGASSPIPSNTDVLAGGLRPAPLERHLRRAALNRYFTKKNTRKPEVVSWLATPLSWTARNVPAVFGGIAIGICALICQRPTNPGARPEYDTQEPVLLVDVPTSPG